jgi:hypothetical protein
MTVAKQPNEPGTAIWASNHALWDKEAQGLHDMDRTRST